MPKFIVDMSLVQSYTKTFEIEAKSEDEADDKAHSEAHADLSKHGPDRWDLQNEDLETDNIEQDDEAAA